jgi:hypothetical protein
MRNGHCPLGNGQWALGKWVIGQVGQSAGSQLGNGHWASRSIGNWEIGSLAIERLAIGNWAIGNWASRSIGSVRQCSAMLGNGQCSAMGNVRQWQVGQC